MRALAGHSLSLRQWGGEGWGERGVFPRERLMEKASLTETRLRLGPPVGAEGGLCLEQREMLCCLIAEPCPSTRKPEKEEPLITIRRKAEKQREMYKHTGIKKKKNKIKLLKWVQQLKPEVKRGLLVREYSSPTSLRA